MYVDPRMLRIQRLIDGADESLRRVPIPVYGIKANRIPALVGTAFLLGIASRTFIVTAAHVLDQKGDAGLRLPGAKGLQPWAMQMYRTRVPGPRDSDKFDIAFNEVPGAILDGLAHYEVVDISRTDQNHRPGSFIQYSFLGYPASQNKPSLKDKTIEPTIQPYHVVTLTERQYEELGLNAASHIAVGFDPPNTKYPDGVVRTPPNPQGISGGPVWCIGSLPEIDAERNSSALVAIAIEHNRRPERLEASRIAFVLQAIKQIFPELQTEIPDSQFLGIGVTVE